MVRMFGPSKPSFFIPLRYFTQSISHLIDRSYGDMYHSPSDSYESRSNSLKSLILSIDNFHSRFRFPLPSNEKIPPDLFSTTKRRTPTHEKILRDLFRSGDHTSRTEKVFNTTFSYEATTRLVVTCPQLWQCWKDTSELLSDEDDLLNTHDQDLGEHEDGYPGKASWMGRLDLLSTSSSIEQWDMGPRQSWLDRVIHLTPRTYKTGICRTWNDCESEKTTFKVYKAQKKIYQMKLAKYEQQVEALGDLIPLSNIQSSLTL